MRPTRMLAAVALAALVGGAAAADDPPANPEYTSWAKFKKGTAVTLTDTLTIGNKVTRVDVYTHRLLEVKEDRVVIETTLVSNIAARGVSKQKPFKTEVKKVFIPRPGAGKEGLALVKPDGTKGEGEETVKIGKAEYKTTWYVANQKDAFGEPLELKVWMSEEVPGLLVKKVVKNVGERPSVLVTEFNWVTKNK